METILSCGIDIGTTTMHVVFSELIMDSVSGGAALPHLQIVERRKRYSGRIHFTPFEDHGVIDAPAVAAIIAAEYERAGVRPREIGSGAVILTGEAARKENARFVIRAVSSMAGSFVVACAGGNLEAIFAGRGSGAAAYSARHDLLVANLDVGGGTTNIALFESGRVVDATCLEIGGHQVELNTCGRMVRHINPRVYRLMDQAGLSLHPGDRTELAGLKTLTDLMARTVIDALRGGEAMSPLTRELTSTVPLKADYTEAVCMISGGVSEFVYDVPSFGRVEEVSVFGDFGPLLGASLRSACDQTGLTLVRPDETIRATVIGAASQATRVSGSTIHVREDILPLQDVPVVWVRVPYLAAGGIDWTDFREKLSAGLSPYRESGVPGVAIALAGVAALGYSDLQKLAQVLVKVTESLESGESPLVVVLEADLALALGQVMARLAGGRPLLCIDEVEVDEGDYIDIGRPLGRGMVVPVVVKTLIFDYQ